MNAEIIKKLKELFESPIGDKLSNIASSLSSKIKNHLGKCFTVKTNFLKHANNIINPLQMFRISAYILLIIASFIMNFRYTKTSIKDYRTVSEEYTKDCTREKLDEIIKKQKEDNEIDKLANFSDINPISKKEDDKYLEDLLKQSDSYQYKMELCNCMDHLIKISEIKIDPRDIFIQLSLELLINESFIKIDLTNKLIISYGIARAMQHLHHNKIVHRNLRPSNIYLDSHYHFFLILIWQFLLKKGMKDYKNNQCSFKVDVYSFGLILWNLFFGKIESNEYENEQQFLDALNKGNHPILPKNFNKVFPKEMSDWKDLISQCCDIEPGNRPSFSSICKTLEKIANKNKNIDKFDFQNYRTEI